MNELLDIIVYFGIGYVIAKAIQSFSASYIEAHKEVRDQLVKKISEVVHAVKVEQHGEITYWFDADSDSFIAQGRTQDEIVQMLKQRFPKHIFIISPSEVMIGPEFKITPFTDRDLAELAK